MNNIVELIGVNKSYGTNHVVKDLNISVEEGEFLTLLGSSGCGKTTTLRMIAGFEEPTTGTIKVEGEPIEEKEPYERNVNTVFQTYALFPHKTIYDNIAYGLKMKKVKKAEIRERVTEMMEMVQLSGFENRYPSQLSGGQKQRVAIARALINRPRVLLLDEPLGALDLKLRKQMQLELKRLQKKLNITFIYVTHDQTEAMTMGDRIVVMKDGVIQQVDSPQNLYKHPQNMFVAGFIGSPQMNFLDATVLKRDGKLVLSLADNELDITDPFESRKEITGYLDKPVKLGIRPEDVTVDSKFIKNNPDKVLTAKLEVSELMGSESYLYLDYSGQKLTARVDADSTTNETVELGILTDRLHLFDPNSTVNIIK